MAVDGEPAGLIAVSDALRPEAPQAIAALRARGVRCAMLTGDGRGPAAAAAAAAGIDPEDTHWCLLPEGKLAMVRRRLSSFCFSCLRSSRSVSCCWSHSHQHRFHRFPGQLCVVLEPDQNNSNQNKRQMRLLAPPAHMYRKEPCKAPLLSFHSKDQLPNFHPILPTNTMQL